MAHYPGELSLGLARRAARAFAVRPAILLDEPFVSLDESTAVRLREGLIVLTRRELRRRRAIAGKARKHLPNEVGRGAKERSD